jgi:hypothetical protein
VWISLPPIINYRLACLEALCVGIAKLVHDVFFDVFDLLYFELFQLNDTLSYLVLPLHILNLATVAIAQLVPLALELYPLVL